MTIISIARPLARSFIRSLVHSHRSFIRLLCTARFTRALSRSLAHEKEVFVDEMNLSISCRFDPLCHGISPVFEEPLLGLPSRGFDFPVFRTPSYLSYALPLRLLKLVSKECPNVNEICLTVDESQRHNLTAYLRYRFLRCYVLKFFDSEASCT